MSGERVVVSRQEAVHQLRSLAAQLENGAIAYRDKRIDVPYEVDIQVHKREVEIDIKWKPHAGAELPATHP